MSLRSSCILQTGHHIVWPRIFPAQAQRVGSPSEIEYQHGGWVHDQRNRKELWLGCRDVGRGGMSRQKAFNT